MAILDNDVDFLYILVLLFHFVSVNIQAVELVPGSPDLYIFVMCSIQYQF